MHMMHMIWPNHLRSYFCQICDGCVKDLVKDAKDIFLGVFPCNQGPRHRAGSCRCFAKYVITSCEYEPEELTISSWVCTAGMLRNSLDATLVRELAVDPELCTVALRAAMTPSTLSDRGRLLPALCPQHRRSDFHSPW
jgi:hypothetical protein